jgi:cytochrome c-type protein NapC
VSHLSPLALVSIALAVSAAAILVWFLIARPPLVRATKLALLLGLGILPIFAAATANIEGYVATQERRFCGSCHVMVPHATDSENPSSLGLASRHARNPFFGDKNCYTCHADYGMFGTVLTKIGGMRHVWLYYTEYRNMPLGEAREKIHLVRPYPNANCMQCHSTESQGWLQSADHRASLGEVRADRVSCASPGCHGYAHPITKTDAPQGASKLPAELARPEAGTDGGAR